ncbi:RNA polymerase sigma factor [Qipengyuania sp. ASV99]|uniref:RNA polymerase sigma factor n=1 Tax=Qipengyuania sp. ASV99 TaxID=3399681 RepID=UPI003A4C7D8E
MTRQMTPDETTRQELIALIPRLRRFARVLTGNLADADDVVQASLEKAMMNLDQWQPGTQLDRWLFRIARNTWLDDRRRAHNRVAHDDIGEMIDHVGEDGIAVAEQQATMRMVRAAVDSLPREQRDVVALVMLEEYTYREAADALDLPIGTVMSRLSRAKAALAKIVAPQGEVQ